MFGISRMGLIPVLWSCKFPSVTLDMLPFAHGCNDIPSWSLFLVTANVLLHCYKIHHHSYTRSRSSLSWRCNSP